MGKRLSILFMSFIGALTSCIHNDVPYPVVTPVFRNITVQGADTVLIDAVNRKVTAILEEETDVSKVIVSNVSFTSDIVKMSPDLNGIFNLKSALPFTLTTYQDYQWYLTAIQPIEYYFTVEGQIGVSTIDDVNHRVIAKVSKGSNLSDINVTSFKLGPRNVSRYSKDLLQIKDFTEPVEIVVKVRDDEFTWKIFLEQSETSIDFSTLDAWTRVAWASAEGIAGNENGFRFRKTGEEQWIDVSGDRIISEGGVFSAAFEDLDPLTAYECVAYTGSEVSEKRSFTTEGEMQIPNGNFEIYSNAESDKYFSWWDKNNPKCNSKWWDSGNQGSTMVGGSAAICTPDTKDKVEGNASARLNSRYVVVKFAAGNLFSGEFAGLEGVSGGMVNFGRPFTLRPRKLSLQLKYQSGDIDNINGYPEGQPVSIGDKDRCQIFIALGDWDYKKYGGTLNCPVQVNTTKKETFFDPYGESVIGYGSFVSNKSMIGWEKVEIPIVYSSTSRVPTHIIISCASSMLGDYFTGSSSSVLWIDDMKLEY